MLKKISEKINKSYENEKQSRDIVFNVLNILIMAASCIMTVVNIATREDGLAIATGLFALLCFLNYLLVKINILKLNISVAVFTVEAMLLLIFFIVSGRIQRFMDTSCPGDKYVCYGQENRFFFQYSHAFADYFLFLGTVWS